MSDTAVAANGIDRNDVREFRGIRYATACRFDPPVDCRQIEMLDGGTRFGPQAPQVSGPLDQLLGAGEIESDEDCHFLNVFTPDCDDARRPVLVFVHGGAFVTGTAAMPWYDGAPLARGGDVVVVTINYRLGALGFLGDRNLGSLDQISALRWVRRFIEKFGGDPERVTVFGESAGGASVVALFAAPEAEQLLHAGWAMSPSIPQLRTAERAQMNERRFLDQLGPAASVADAREASVEDVLAAQIGDARLAASMQSFTPTHDTEVFPNDIVAAAANDTRPLVIGTTRDEMQLFAAFDPARSEWTEDHLSSEFQRRFGERADEAIAIYRRLDPEGTVSQLVSAMQTDEVFRQPSIALAEARVSQSNPTWMYLFDQTSSAFGGRMASCHGLDLPFAFDTLSARGAKMFTGSHDGLSTVAEQFSGALIAFARQCEPGWPAYSLEGRQTQRIGPHPQVVDDPEADRRKLWSTGESPS